MRVILDAIEEALGVSARWKGEGGRGPLSSNRLVETSEGRLLFVKQTRDGSTLESESRSLQLLKEVGAIPVPEVIVTGSDFLVMEYVERGIPSDHFAEEFGRTLARQHRATSDAYGLHYDNYCGLTPQPNGWMNHWVEFFCERRLRYQQQLLLDKNQTDPVLHRGIDRICEHLGSWLDEDESPALLHGDLWSGNFLVGANGYAVIIDPASYYGSREADLAMTELFGGFPPGFYTGYQQEWPLSQGYEQRRDLYNLYHVLNHVNLFGGGYLAQAQSLVARY
jgi:protein-ribulosamine 3-kinase